MIIQNLTNLKKKVESKETNKQKKIVNIIWKPYLHLNNFHDLHHLK